MKTIKIIYTAALAVLASTTFAQTEATTANGKKVLLNQDGTWKYAENSAPKTAASFDCSELIETDSDKMTGKSNTGAKDMLVVSDDGGKNGFGIYILQGSSTPLIFSIQAVGASSCIDDDSKMNVLFRDGSRLELVNDGKFNCDADFTLYFGGAFGKTAELELFKTKEIETLRVWTSKGYVENDFTAEQSVQLMKTVECLLNN